MSRLAYLVEQIDRYGEAIECDLHVHYRLDLLDFFRGVHSWRKLQGLLERLPAQGSAYREAMFNDPEVADLLAAQPEQDGPPPAPPWSTYTAERASLDNVIDRLGELIVAVCAAGGLKPPSIQPMRRPVTGVDLARLRRDKKAHDDLVAEVMAAQERYANATGDLS